MLPLGAPAEQDPATAERLAVLGARGLLSLGGRP